MFNEDKFYDNKFHDEFDSETISTSGQTSAKLWARVKQHHV